MNRVPLSEKNAYLSIFMGDRYLHSSLLYSHYGIGRNYSHEVNLKLKMSDLSALESEAFWEEYFNELETQMSWNLINRSSTEIRLNDIQEFVNEGEGVAGINFIVSKSVKNRSRILSKLHSLVPTVGISAWEQSAQAGDLAIIAAKHGYEEIMWLDMDYQRFDILHLQSASEGRGNLKAVQKEWSVNTGKIHWDTQLSLADSIKDNKLQAFGTYDYSDVAISNSWANLITQYRPSTLGDQLEDVVRSFMTVQLLTIYNRSKIGKEFGKGRRALFVITGEILEHLDEHKALVALLDGLQLRGSFDLLIDKRRRFQHYLHTHAEGVNTSDFIIPRDLFLEPFYKVYILEVPGRGTEKSAVFSGEIVSNSSGVQDIFALSGDITYFDLPAQSERVAFTGDFVKGAYVEGIDGGVELLSNSETRYKKIVVDSRFKPVVYGPDHRANSNKLKRWTK